MKNILSGTTKKTYKIYHNMNVAHFCCVHMYHRMNLGGKIGCMAATVTGYALTSKPEDVLANLKYSEKLLYSYLDLVTRGEYSNILRKDMEKHKVTLEIKDSDLAIMEAATSKVDFISFSYYMTVGITATSQAASDDKTEQKAFMGQKNPSLEQSAYGWAIDPIGLRHIEQMKLAIVEDGVELIGYLPWGFIDLVSSSDGYRKRYGFVYVNRDEFDLKDMRRIKKDSFYWYKDVIASNGEKL